MPLPLFPMTNSVVSLTHRLQAVFLHQADHALATHTFLLLDKIFVNAGAAVPLLARAE